METSARDLAAPAPYQRLHRPTASVVSAASAHSTYFSLRSFVHVAMYSSPPVAARFERCFSRSSALSPAACAIARSATWSRSRWQSSRVGPDGSVAQAAASERRMSRRRDAALQSEQTATNTLHEEGNSLRLQQRPRPEPPPQTP